MMLVQTRWNGLLFHSIEHGAARSNHRGAPLGAVTASLKLTQADAAKGIDALVRENFPEIAPQEDSYGGA